MQPFARFCIKGFKIVLMESYMNLGQNQISVQQFPDTVQSWKRDGYTFYFYCTESALEVSVKSDKVIRFRYSPESIFQRDFSYSGAHNYEGKVKALDIKEDEEKFTIYTAFLDIIITKHRLLVTILDKEGKVVIDDEKGFHWEEHKDYGGEIVMMSKKVQSGEHFFGLGDKPTDLNLRGKRFELWGKDTYGFMKNADPLYKNIPFFLGLHHKIGYGVLFDNSFRTFFDFGFERKNVYSYWAHGGEMNYYFIYGPELMDVVETYTNMTGKPELPPLWSLGYHQCKWSYYPEKVVKNIAAEFRKRSIPCDALYLDIDYMDGFRCFTWNKDYFPDPKGLTNELSKDGYKLVVIIDPGIKIDKNYWVYQEAIEKDYFCKRQDGPLMRGSVWPGKCNFPDFTNPEVREWWSGLFKGLIETGVRGVWNDMNEPAVFEIETFPNDVRHNYDGDPCSHRKAHNVFGMQMAKATYDGIKRFLAPNYRPFNITRSAYSGIQKYSSVWTGDNVASWEHLWLANVMCQRLAVSGISFCGSDIGGFIETPSGEMYIRWLQLGIFHAFCRTHSSGDHGDQEPWSFGEEYAELAKKTIELRYRLLPYLYTTFWQYSKFGTPFLRPLTFLDQSDTETYFRQDEFGVGDNLLVIPVTQAEADGRWLYLPSGVWYYFWDDERFHGNMEVWAEADLNRVPIFVRAGSVIPMYPVMQYVGEIELKELILHAYYYTKSHTSVVYEDSGDGYGYEQGQYNVRTFNTSGSDNQFVIEHSAQGEFTPTYHSYAVNVHGLSFEPRKCEVDGQEVAFTMENQDKNEIKVMVPIHFGKLVIS